MHFLILQKRTQNYLYLFFLLSFGLGFNSNAQTSRVASLPKSYTVDLAQLDKEGFSKDKVGRKLKKEAHLTYLDSLNKLKKELKLYRKKIDSLEDMSSPKKAVKVARAKSKTQIPSQLLLEDSVRKTKERFLTGLSDKLPSDIQGQEELSKVLKEVKSYSKMDSTSMMKQVMDSLSLGDEYKTFTEVMRDKQKLADSLNVSGENIQPTDSLQTISDDPGLSDSLTVAPKDTLQVDSLSRSEMLRELYAQQLKEELTEKSEELEGKFYELKELGYLKEQQSGLESISKELDEVNKQAETIRDYESIKEGISENQDKLLGELADVDPELLSTAQKVVSKEQKSAFGKLSNIFGLNKYNNPYSLKEEPFKKRIVLGGNLQIVQFENPFLIDLSPRVGVKLNKIFVVGVELNYRAPIGAYDSTKTNGKVVTKVPEKAMGYRLYLNGFITHGFFGHVEFESMRSSDTKANTSDATNSFVWKSGWLAGIGKQYSLASKVNGTITLLYSFNNKENNLYTNPFQIRFGFDMK